MVFTGEKKLHKAIDVVLQRHYNRKIHDVSQIEGIS